MNKRAAFRNALHNPLFPAGNAEQAAIGHAVRITQRFGFAVKRNHSFALRSAALPLRVGPYQPLLRPISRPTPHRCSQSCTLPGRLYAPAKPRKIPVLETGTFSAVRRSDLLPNCTLQTAKPDSGNIPSTHNHYRTETGSRQLSILHFMCLFVIICHFLPLDKKHVSHMPENGCLMLLPSLSIPKIPFAET